MTRYADYVPLFTAAENAWTNRQCTSCQKLIPGGRLDEHVDTEHRNAEDQGLMVKVNDIWWRKRGY